MVGKSNGEIFTEIVLETFKVSGLFNAEGDELTKEFGLSSARWKVMGAIQKSHRLLTVPEIGRAMGQSRQATQRVVDVMTTDGLLQMIENPNHKRAKHIVLTEAGQRVYDLLGQKQMVWANNATENLTQEELEQALSTLRKLTRYFDQSSC